MKNLISKFTSLFKPTTQFKEALKNLKAGDILYLSQGAIPNKYIAGYQIVTSTESGLTYITWGHNQLSDLLKNQKSITDGILIPERILSNGILFDIDTGTVFQRGDLKVSEIRSDNVVLHIYPSMAFYYVFMYGFSILNLVLLVIFPIPVLAVYGCLSLSFLFQMFLEKFKKDLCN